MKPTRRDVLAGFAACPVVGIAWAASSPSAGNVEAIRGSAFALKEAVRRPLASPQTCFVGEQVATGARSALAMRLGAATTPKIDRYPVNAGGILELGQGAMVFDRNEPAPKADLAVRSPFGLMAVRGTRFFAGPNNGVFGVFVERGLVTVVGASTEVEVGPGLGMDIAVPAFASVE
jgi:hypothetical protein